MPTSISLGPDVESAPNPYGSHEGALSSFLTAYWLERTEEDVLHQWRVETLDNNFHARLLIRILKEISEAPFEGVVDSLISDGGICLYHPESETTAARDFTYDEYHIWFKEHIQKLTQIEDESRNSPPGVLRELLLRFWKNDGIEAAIKRWYEYVEIDRGEASAVIAKLNKLLDDPPDNLSKILKDFGNISLYHQSENSARPYNEVETLEWLRDLVQRLNIDR